MNAQDFYDTNTQSIKYDYYIISIRIKIRLIEVDD